LSLVLFSAHVAAPIAHFISLEVVNLVEALSRIRPVATVWPGALIAERAIEMVIYVAAEVVTAMEPRAGANEYATRKPFRAVIALRSTIIRLVVIVTIRAVRSRSNIDADAYLGLCFGSGRREADGSDASY